MGTKLKSGHEVVPLTDSENEERKRNFAGYKNGMVRLQPDGWIFTPSFDKFADKIFNFEFKPSDVVVMTYVKSGTTWMQEIIWTMRNNPDLNHPMAGVPVMVRCPYLDFDFILDNMMPDYPDGNEMVKTFKFKFPGADPREGMFLQMANALPHPRTIKTHLPLSLFNSNFLEGTKIVYVARNPKDVCMSYYHHCRLLKSNDYVGTLDQFIDYFMEEKLVYDPYWKHVEEAWKVRNHKNMHFIFYEELKKDPKKEQQKLDQFIGTNLSDQQINNVVHHTSFASMKSRDSVAPNSNDENSIFNLEVLKSEGGFFRKGEAGSWQKKLTEEQDKRLSKWIEEKNKNLNIPFQFK